MNQDEKELEADRRAKNGAQATNAANARVMSRYELAKRNAELKSPPRMSTEKDNRHERR